MSIHAPARSRHPAPPEPATAAVHLDGVAVQLGGRTVWSGASLDIAGGELIAVLGPNGAGKSTLLRLLLGLLSPATGSVEVLGRPPHRGNSWIGYVPQRRTVDPDLAARGRDLVHLGIDGHRWGVPLPHRRRHDRTAVEAAVEAVGATAYVDRPIGHLSGGEQQRFLLAQALVGNPRLLLLDEPLASLDIRNQTAVAHLVATVARERGITVLLVTHDVNLLIPVVDRLIYVARGRVLIGAPEEVLTSDRLSALYGSPVEVVTDRSGRLFVVGLDDEVTHPHGDADGHDHHHPGDGHGHRDDGPLLPRV